MTVIQFNPSQTSVTQFQATLDGQPYNVIVNWNLFGVRYYVNVYDLSNNLIVCRPLVGSPLGYNLATVSYNGSFVTATTATPHTYTVGSVVQLTVSGCSPDDFNGTFLCNIISTTQFTYLLSSPYVTNATAGSVVYNMSLVAGYFNSTLTYFPDSQQFVVLP